MCVCVCVCVCVCHRGKIWSWRHVLQQELTQRQLLRTLLGVLMSVWARRRHRLNRQGVTDWWNTAEQQKGSYNRQAKGGDKHEEINYRKKTRRDKLQNMNVNALDIEVHIKYNKCLPYGNREERLRLQLFALKMTAACKRTSVSITIYRITGKTFQQQMEKKKKSSHEVQMVCFKLPIITLSWDIGLLFSGDNETAPSAITEKQALFVTFMTWSTQLVILG